MYRINLVHLQAWLGSPRRKPLVLRGARQVGKTWLVREFARQQGLSLIELNFEKNPQHSKIFLSNDVHDILLSLEAVINKTIIPEKTLLFLDEMQAAPELFAKLRWLAEDLPNLPVIATGSLLDFTLKKHNFSMPVGRLGYMFLHPLSFQEFLIATERKRHLEYIQNYNLTDKLLPTMHEQLCQAVREYVLVGGMPEAVMAWLQTKSLLEVSQVHHNLINTYRDDFAKYDTRINRERLDEVLLKVPAILGQKFKPSLITKEQQANTVQNACMLLENAKIINKIYSTDATGLPLDANRNEKIFKCIFLDIGLVSAMLNLKMQNTSQGFFNLSLVNDGGLAEQLVGQGLLCNQEYFQQPALNYWMREKQGSAAEVDYIIQHNGNIVPLEVKSGSTGSLKSLHMLAALRDFKIAVRINNDIPSVVDVNTLTQIDKKAKYKLISLPFYLLEQLSRLLK